MSTAVLPVHGCLACPHFDAGKGKGIAHVQLRAEIELIIAMHFLIFLNEEYKSNSPTLYTKAAAISCYPCCCCGCRYDETSLHFL